MADEQQAGTRRPALGKSSCRKASRLSASSAEVGSSAMTSSGWPISARAAATRCCWPMESASARRSEQLRCQPGCSSRLAAAASVLPCRLRARSARSRENGRADRRFHAPRKGQQVELLKDVAGVIDPEAITGARRQAAEVTVEQAHAAARGLCTPPIQTEQGGLAAARGAFEKQALAALRGESRGCPAARPGVARRSRGCRLREVERSPMSSAGSERQLRARRGQFRALLAVGADQLYLNLLRAGESFEQALEIQRTERPGLLQSNW